MRSFNSLIFLFLVVLFAGFIFYRDGFTKNQKNITVSAKSPPQTYINRMQYLDYSAQNLASSEKFGKTVLFFAATTWCSNCAALDAEIKKRINELPPDVTILKVDYDNDKETNAKYGVTIQTTLVLLDNNEKEEKRWIGTGSFDDLMKNIN